MNASLIPFAGVLLAVAVGVFLATRDSFWWTDLSYRLPFVGKLSHYAKDYSETRNGHWLNVEANLCRDYARHCTSMSKDQFQNARLYLRKSFDHGRKPIPMWMLALLIFLICAEAAGFSYMLSALMAAESSENVRDVLTILIVLVLAAILVWVMHAAGHQLYRTNLLRSCFRQFQAQSVIPGGKRNRQNSFTTKIISLNDDQSVDDDEPMHVQFANRVVSHPGDRGSYAWVWVAAFLIFVIALGSVNLRMGALHQMNQEIGVADDPSAMTGFALLAVIFIVTQFVGIGVGYRYGFAGRESREAFRETRGCANFEVYFRPIRHRMNLADLRLTSLHQKMEVDLPLEIEWDRSFYDFVREERLRGVTDLHDPASIDPSHPKPKPVLATIASLNIVESDESNATDAEKSKG